MALTSSVLLANDSTSANKSPTFLSPVSNCLPNIIPLIMSAMQGVINLTGSKASPFSFSNKFSNFRVDLLRRSSIRGVLERYCLIAETKMRR